MNEIGKILQRTEAGELFWFRRGPRRYSCNVFEHTNERRQCFTLFLESNGAITVMNSFNEIVDYWSDSPDQGEILLSILDAKWKVTVCQMLKSNKEPE